MDLPRSIRMAVDTGKVVLGTQQTLQLLLTGSPKLIVVSSNCPPQSKSDLMQYSTAANVATIEFAGTSIELGKVCGKPFPVAMLAVLEEGNSDILSTSLPAITNPA